MTALLEVPFRGDTIACVETPERVLVAMKPICERVGLAWQPQHRKLAAEPELWGVTMMMIPSAGGMQETACIPLTRLAAWLFTISPNKVKPELREALIAYRNEAADVLDAHFRLRVSEKDAEIALLRGQLAWCHRILTKVTKWARIKALMEGGLSHRWIANEVNMRHWEVAETQAVMENCGYVPLRGEASDPPTLIEELRQHRLRERLDRERRALDEARRLRNPDAPSGETGHA